MFRSIDEYDSGGESEAEKCNVLDWELWSSDEISASTLTCVTQGQHACKLTNLLLYRIFEIGLYTTAPVVTNLEKILRLMSGSDKISLYVLPYMPNKPDKFGIKFRLAIDVDPSTSIS